MTRKRKDVKAEDVKVKVCVFAFDLLFLNGEPAVKKSLRERRQLLHDSFQPTEGEFAFAQHSNTNELDEIQSLLEESVKASCEGLMVKMLDTDESGYEPSKRSRNWLKVDLTLLSVFLLLYVLMNVSTGQERLPSRSWRLSRPSRTRRILWPRKANLSLRSIPVSCI